MHGRAGRLSPHTVFPSLQAPEQTYCTAAFAQDAFQAVPWSSADILKWIWPYNGCQSGHYPLIKTLITTTSPRGRFTTGLWMEPQSAVGRRVSFKIHRMYNWRAKCTQTQSIEISLFVRFMNSRVLYSQFFLFFLQGRNCSKNWKALNCDIVRCYYSLSSQ